jgi:hypothetical protein
MSFYLPLTHPEKPDHWRVPVYRDDSLYTIKLDIDFTRVFTEQSLPTYIKTKIVIADAGYEPSTARNVHKNLFGLSDVFIYRGSYGLQDTAWRVNDKHYVVVLDKVEMRTLRGEIDGDAREES